MIVNQSDVETVERNHADLFETFSGFPEPPRMDSKLAKLEFK